VCNHFPGNSGNPISRDLLWAIVQATKHMEQFSKPLFDELSRLGDGEHAAQLCELPYHYAAAGDVRAIRRPFPPVETNRGKEIV
jgi:hypothetical protein